jgi:pimeloyl-ACP methyl ester carboxylesterase
MPFLRINGCNYFYKSFGDEQNPKKMLFSHGLLWSHKMFRDQIEYFMDFYHVIAYDHRGQGKSEVTATGYEMDQLYEDALELIRELALGKVTFVGLSMGGFVGLRLAARKPEIVEALVLMNTTAQDEPNTLKYKILTLIVSAFGVKSVTKPVMKIMFGDYFLYDAANEALRAEWRHELEANPKSILKAVKGVTDRKGVENELEQIVCPTLIIAGKDDRATVPQKSYDLKKNVKNAELVEIPDAGHSTSIEQPEAVINAMKSFLKN